jgi:hypothetical protein
MRTYLELGPTPAEESCAQVGDPDYSTKARAECQRFVDQILRHYPDTDHSGYVTIKRFPHDFGTYYEVCAVYDEDDSASVDWAYDIEADKKGVLSRWDS